MPKAVTSSLNGAGTTWGTYASNGLSPAVYDGAAVPVVVTFQPDAKNAPSGQNK